MLAPRKYDTETRARAVRMYRDRLTDYGESMIERAVRSSVRCSTSTRPRYAAGSNATTSTTATGTA